MRDFGVDRAEVFVIGPNVDKLTWAEGMSGQFMTNIILRLTTAGGLEGIAGAVMITSNCYDKSIGEALRALLPDIMGATPMEREAIWQRMNLVVCPIMPQAQSLIDIAFWDMAARYANLPLYQLLGGARDKVLSYASTPLLKSNEAYIDYVHERKAEGFKAVKFHCWCNPERDLSMCEAVHREFADDGLQMMLDVEQRYNLRSAVTIGRQLGQMGFAWFEAPLPDTNLEGYKLVKQKTSVPIVPHGNVILDLHQIEQAIRMDCWSAVRIDTTLCGGITPIRKIMGLAESAHMNVEIQCWGYTLSQAANLHVMLAFTNCSYFEQPFPYPPFEYGAVNTIRTDKNGFVHAPNGPGLGIQVDWEAVRAATILNFEVHASSRKQ